MTSTFFSTLTILAIASTVFQYQPALAAPCTSPDLVISQLQVDGTTLADEFIEVHNNSTSTRDMSGY